MTFNCHVHRFCWSALPTLSPLVQLMRYAGWAVVCVDYSHVSQQLVTHTLEPRREKRRYWDFSCQKKRRKRRKKRKKRRKRKRRKKRAKNLRCVSWYQMNLVGIA